MSPYPPGTSASDPRAPWNAPDRSHEHEWRPIDDAPIIEDGAAIFHEECRYAEGRYGEGWQCEETRTYRFEYSELVSPDGESTDLYDIGDWNQNSGQVREKIISIEERFSRHEHGKIDVDPDPDCGVVVIKMGGWELRYEP
jgi:hypothetical protein